MLRLQRYLMAASARAEATLEQKFGSHVHALLNELHQANHIEPDMGERRRWRLTALGRAAARRALTNHSKAA